MFRFSKPCFIEIYALDLAIDPILSQIDANSDIHHFLFFYFFIVFKTNYEIYKKITIEDSFKNGINTSKMLLI